MAKQIKLASVPRASIRHRMEYAAVVCVVGILRVLPRGLARRVGGFAGVALGHAVRRLRTVASHNLQLAMPALSPVERSRIMTGTFRNLGIQLSEFCQMTRYTAAFASREVFRYEGLQNYLRASARGRGVLVLTGHLGAWELSSFLHSLCGFPMGMVIRRLDNPLIDRLVNRIRCHHGNRILHKSDFARGLLRAMHSGEAVGILMDTNMTPPQGVFVPFFGMDACTASGMARVARKTGAAVLPGFLLWKATENRYVLHFGEEVEVQKTDDEEKDAVANTARFTRVLERYIRSYPDQWLWMHRRWKTRPPGELPIYSTSPARARLLTGAQPAPA